MQAQFEEAYHNHRPYVEAFFQIHQADIEELKADILIDKEKVKG